MIKIIICGTKSEEGICETLVRALSKYGVVQVVKDGINEDNQNVDFLICICSQIPKSINGSGIIIFKESYNFNEKNKIKNEFIPIFSGQNKQAALTLVGTNNIAISCGTSSKDTISASSIGRDRCTISLQRDIKDLNSNVIESHEFIVNLKKEVGIYPLLISCATLLLIGIESFGGYSF